MMLGLLANIFPHGLNVDGANAERTVTGLPCEIGIRGVTLPKSLSGNWEGCCGEGFWLWARRRSPSIAAAGVRTEPTKRTGKRPAARRVSCHRPAGFVAPQSKIHEGYSPSSRLAIQPLARKQHPSEFSVRR